MPMPDSDSDDELPPLWEERATLEGSVYYVHHGDKHTQWTHPRTGVKKRVVGDMPFGWTRLVTNEGKVLFVDHKNQRTSYSDPRLAFATEDKEGANHFRQRFDGSTTALHILHGIDLQGKVAVITGANSGIGWETARSLALHGCDVIYAVRKVQETKDLLQTLRKERPSVKCRAIFLDLASLKSVQDFVVNLKKTVSHVDMLILNAGIFGIPFETTEDGFEKMFQVNHLAHFYLAQEMKPLLRRGARVVVLSSESHRFANLSFPLSWSELSPSYSSSNWSMQTYNNTKLCNVLFAKELAHRWDSDFIHVYAVHPGNMVSSGLSRNWWFYRILFAMVRPFTKSLQQAASTSVFCATARELEHTTGLYFNNCWCCETSHVAQQREMSQDLWNLSCRMIDEWRLKTQVGLGESRLLEWSGNVEERDLQHK